MFTLDLRTSFVSRLALLVASAAFTGCGDRLTSPMLDATRARNPHVASVLSVSGTIIRLPIDPDGLGEPSISETYAEYDDAVANAYHTGVDFLPSVSNPNPTVYPALPGTVVLIQQNGRKNCNARAHECSDHGFGNTVIISHGALEGVPSVAGVFYTQYSHLDHFDDAILALCGKGGGKKGANWSSDGACQPNAPILTTTPLGAMGDTQYGSAGPDVHLHFETKTFGVLNSVPGNGVGCSISTGGTGFGYNCADPDVVGYFSPNLLFHQVELATGTVEVTLPDGSQLRIGPGDLPTPASSRQYRAANLATGTEVFVARRTSTPSSGCASGWLELSHKDGSLILDADNPPPHRVGSVPRLPSVWACAALPSPFLYQETNWDLSDVLHLNDLGPAVVIGSFTTSQPVTLGLGHTKVFLEVRNVGGFCTGGFNLSVSNATTNIGVAMAPQNSIVTPLDGQWHDIFSTLASHGVDDVTLPAGNYNVVVHSQCNNGGLGWDIGGDGFGSFYGYIQP